MPPRRAPVNDNQGENSVNRRGNSQGNGPPPPLADAATRALERMARLFEQQIQKQQLQQQQHLQQPPRPQHDIYDQFWRLGPKEFSGTTDPFAAESWIRSLEVHFRYLDMGDADRVRCTTYLFRYDASLWWEGSEHSVDLATFTWTRFKEIFYKKYFTADARGRLMREFMTLRQGDSTVADFVKKFDRCCHFVPLIAGDPAMKHFMDGLRPILRNNVMMMRPLDYATTTTYAFQSEQSLKDIDFENQRKMHHFQNNNQPNKNPFMGPPRPQGPQKPQGPVKKPAPPKPQNSGASNPTERQPCKKCNRLYLGKCECGSFKCFYCKEAGHKANDCPKRKADTTARACVMNAEEAEEEAYTTLITGHIISSDGVEVDPSKVEAVKEWPVPKNVTEIHSFLGLAGYYRKFIQGFSSIASEIQWFELTVYARGKALNLATSSVRSTFRDRIRDGQSTDEQLQKWRARDEAKDQNLYLVVDGLVRYRDRLWVPSDDMLRDLIMKEAHDTPYSIHPRSTKIYKYLQLLYWWPEMNRDIVRFVSECLTCQKVKVEHQYQRGN
ncbi:uncharacterized protein [Primulina eburnea]|uniref:uncharacterized protein n=1 Tax=Primulina eburnea TaxID=1245227 RepID=UPI003C6C4989